MTWQQAHPKASQFRSKGWSHLETMRSLMPTTAKGANVYRASQGNHVHTTPPDVPELKDDVIEDEDNAIRWSPSPSPKAHSPAPPTDQHTPMHPVAADRKRKYSALSACLTLATGSPHSTPSTSSKAGPSSKRHKEITGPAALQGLRAELSTFGQSFIEVTTPPTPLLAPSPSQKTKAIQRAQELEDELDDDRLAALIRVFQADVNAADAYLVLKRDGLRKAWIASTLGGI